mmetsp:Transcript_9181/g.11785  ORF Transcript_9181/g.11785 Transcript_9181/m.11785 type:complete len:182 (-) Transcript_9181:286-831(-)|eukprot:CAMPEP_0185778424 /NCGR_PEP_ID=MMETSP1174-20130828/92450_1 /TAXON_ID=35687 /ORGANISM="Dictyocha speculum, Strain CCMP1381" /LENGTH=181 /DNA_ID=CAMNT_0028467133 /DNA_START=68 /DNA_END=613 /DNA_ORIENTATION=+
MPKLTTIDKVVVAIRALKDHRGSSRQALTKYLKSEFSFDNAGLLKKSLKKAVSDGVITQHGQSFRVACDEVYAAPVEAQVICTDIKIGSGERMAEHGDSVTVRYVGKLSTGYQFDRANAFSFTLGAGDVIKGWDQGIVGMKKSGQRKLVVPAKLGYGKKGCAPDIPPNAELHFTVKLEELT